MRLSAAESAFSTGGKKGEKGRNADRRSNEPRAALTLAPPLARN